MSEFILCLADEKIPFQPRYDDTVKYFQAFGRAENVSKLEDDSLLSENSDSANAGNIAGTDNRFRLKTSAGEKHAVSIPNSDWQMFLSKGLNDDAHTEYSALTPYFSDELVLRDKVILHAVAIRWRDRAYLICAGSGTGKSTQARFLQELRPGEFSIICGDRPILQFLPASSENEDISGKCQAIKTTGGVSFVADQPRFSHSSDADVQPRPKAVPASERLKSMEWESRHSKRLILVHPSPWNGKENWHGADTAPLAGLIVLERGEENSLVSLKPRDAVLSIYPQFIQTGREPDMIRKIAELETCLLQSVPIWKLTSFQVPASTRLLIEKVFC